MPIAVYIKENTAEKIQKTKKRDRTFSTAITFLGLVAIVAAVWPYLSWQLVTVPKLTGKIESFPIPQAHVLSSTQTFTADVQVVSDPDGFSYFTTTAKLPAATPGGPGARPNEFLLTIPKLKIEKAKVKVDTTNFYDHLALFPGTAIPGEVGNSFITGHSVLPEFNDPQNYRTIFTKLPDLEVGDDVFAQVGEKTYHYTVQYSKIVDPHDTSVLLPISSTGHNLTLMTCVPPGTSSKRLVVITSLI